MRFNSGFKGLNWRSDVDIRPTMVQEAFAKISAADFRLVPEGCCNGGMSHIPPPSGSALLSIGFRDAYVWGRNLHFSFRSATHPVGNTWRPVKFLHKSAEWLRNSHLLTKEQQSGMSSVYKRGGGEMWAGRTNLIHHPLNGGARRTVQSRWRLDSQTKLAKASDALLSQW